MKKEISDLIKISRQFGSKKEYTLGGGGNTSYKDDKNLYVKASGYSLADITAEGFAVLDRKKLSTIMNKKYPEDPYEREEKVKIDLLNCNVNPESRLRPSVEASLHDIFQHTFIVHTHPYLVNALLCSQEVVQFTKKLFGDEVIYIPYVDPGYILSKTVTKYLDEFRNKKGKEPDIIFLQNHGVFVGGNTIARIEELYSYIEGKIMSEVNEIIKIESIDYQGSIKEIIAILSGLLGKNSTYKYRFNTLIAHFTKDSNSISRVDKPFIPDHIVYCKAHPLVISIEEDLTTSRASIENSLGTFRQKFGYDPKIVLIEKGPVIAVENNDNNAELLLDVFEDAMKISFYSNFFGGPNFMTGEEIRFIENWEVENYRRNLSVSQ